MNKEYEIVSKRINTGKIVAVSFTISFTDEFHPGVSSSHFGTIMTNLLDTATDEEIITAIEAALVYQMPDIENFHQSQIEFNYMMENSEEVDTTAPTNEDVNRERDRRIAEGSTFNIPGYGYIRSTAREQDKVAYTVLFLNAQGYKNAGVTDPVIVLRDADNTIHNLTPDQFISFYTIALQWIQDTMQVSWDMKDAVGDFPNGIPADYDNDIYWP